MRMKNLAVFSLVLFLAGCESLPQRARDAIAGARGFITQAQANHLTECRAEPAKPLCQAINRAIDAQNFAIDALIVYCSSDEFLLSGSGCKTNELSESQLREALKRLDQMISELKGVLQ